MNNRLFNCCGCGLVVFGREDSGGNLIATPFQSHHHQRTVPGKTHCFVYGTILRAVVVMSSGNEEPMGAIKYSYHNLAFPEACWTPFGQGSVNRSITDRDFEFSVCVDSEE